MKNRAGDSGLRVRFLAAEAESAAFASGKEPALKRTGTTRRARGMPWHAPTSGGTTRDCHKARIQKIDLHPGNG
jgi:hypothetical protein